MNAMLITHIECDNPNKGKGAAIHNFNALAYIATRDGVDMTDIDLEQQIRQMEQENQISSNEQYMKYIHNRTGSQGLFGNIDVSNPYDTAKYVSDLTKQGRVIYRGFVSLREDDALQLGFDEKQAWVDYIRQVMPDIAKEFHIPIDKLEWAGAFHVKEGHPHCHFMFWSKDPMIQKSFVSVGTNVRCRELLSKEMFHMEQEQAVIDKTIARDLLLDTTKAFSEDELNLLFQRKEKMSSLFKTEDVQKFSKELLQFSATLPASGRLVYKLLPPESKKELDALTDRILKTQPLATDYYRYLIHADAISDSYSASEHHRNINRQIADEDIRKRMGNQILRTCKKMLSEKELLSQYYPQFQKMLEESPKSEVSSPDPIDNADFIPPELTPPDLPSPILLNPKAGSTVASEMSSLDIHYKMDWSADYKQAMKMLYDDTVKDKTDAVRLLTKESAGNNILASHELAKLYEKGISVEKNAEKAHDLYEKARAGFECCLSDPKYKKMHSYIHYRIGKYYERGLGTPQDDSKAIRSFINASHNKYAQYALASMYKMQKGITITAENKSEWLKTICQLYKSSADQDFPYAAYAYAKNLEENPTLLPCSEAEIKQYYTQAFEGFSKMLQENGDDNLYYRLGTMYYGGKGTAQDQDKAVECFLKSAEYHNANAQYALGKTYADSNTKYYNLDKAHEMFQLAAAQDNPYAALALADLYSDRETSYYNPHHALKLYQDSLAKLPEQASYKLGMLYASEECPFHNTEKAIEHLKYAADTYSNQYAQYALARILLNEKSPAYSFECGFDYLNRSVSQGNLYARTKLGSMYLWGTRDLKADVPLGKAILQNAVKDGSEYASQTLTMYENYQKDIAVSFTFSLCRSLLESCAYQNRREQLEELLPKPHKKKQNKEQHQERESE